MYSGFKEFRSRFSWKPDPHQVYLQKIARNNKIKTSWLATLAAQQVPKVELQKPKPQIKEKKIKPKIKDKKIKPKIMDKKPSQQMELGKFGFGKAAWKLKQFHQVKAMELQIQKLDKGSYRDRWEAAEVQKELDLKMCFLWDLKLKGKF